jgi:hypothetical protein
MDIAAIRRDDCGAVAYVLVTFLFHCVDIIVINAVPLQTPSLPDGETMW